MRHHDGRKRVNKLDGGKGRVKKQYHKALRSGSRREVQKLVGEAKAMLYDTIKVKFERLKKTNKKLREEVKRRGWVIEAHVNMLAEKGVIVPEIVENGKTKTRRNV